MSVSPDRLCEQYAAAHHGVLPHEKARAFGLSARQIRSRIESGRWVALHPRVYCIAGTPRTWERDMLAGCMWCRGVASHRAAARWYRLPGFDKAGVELTTLKQRALPRCGIVVHHTRRLPGEQVTTYRKIPITSVERTLMDLAAVTRRRNVAIALDAALRRNMTDIQKLDRLLYLVARRGRRGCGILRELVNERAPEARRPESPLETELFELLASSGIPMPQMQVPLFDGTGCFIGRFDFVYPTERLVLEVQSFEWHSGRNAWQRDLDVYNELTTASYRLLQLKLDDIRFYPDRTLARIEEARAAAREPLAEKRAADGES